MLLNLKAYHRPASLAEALELLNTGQASLLAGGTELLGRTDSETEAVIDLAPLDLAYIQGVGDEIRIGAMTTLRELAGHPAVAALAGGILVRAIRQAAPATLRAAATLGGTLAGRKGGEEIPTVLRALGARVTLATPDPVDLPLELLLANRADALAGAILTEVRIPVTDQPGGYAAVSRTPADRAIVCAAAVGERVAVGGADGQDDHRGSAEYRRQVAPVLVRRALAEARGEGRA